jgi:2,3-bisphosphoglycerate-independent phosphoglycerate mutase
VIEAVDGSLFALIAEELVRRADLRVVVTSDHATCWSVGTHTGDLVPLIVADRRSRGGALRLTEQACAAGSLDIAGAWSLMPRLFDVDDV